MGQQVPSLLDASKDFPIVGGFISNAHQIQRIVTAPCDPEPYMLALGAWHSLPMLIWGIFGPDCVDLAYDRVGRRHSKTRRGKLQATGFQIGTPPPGGFGWSFFSLSEFLQKAGFWLGVADASADFIVNSMTGAMTLDGCGVPGSAYGLGGPAPADAVIIFTNGWHNFSWAPVESRIFVMGGPTCAIPQGYDYMSSFTFQVTTFPGQQPPTIAMMRVVDDVTGNIVAQGSGDDDGSGGLRVTATSFSPTILHPGHNLRTEVFVDEPCLATGSTWRVSGIYTGTGLGPLGCGSVTEKAGPPKKWWQDFMKWAES